MLKIGDRVRTKSYTANDDGNAVCHTGIIIDVSVNTALIKFDDWGKFRIWKDQIDQILSMTILCA